MQSNNRRHAPAVTISSTSNYSSYGASSRLGGTGYSGIGLSGIGGIGLSGIGGATNITTGSRAGGITTTSGTRTGGTTTKTSITTTTVTRTGGTTTNGPRIGTTSSTVTRTGGTSPRVGGTTTTTVTRTGVTTTSGPKTSVNYPTEVRTGGTTTTSISKTVETKKTKPKTSAPKTSSRQKTYGEGLTMIIDSKVNKGEEGVFYFLPSEMNKLGLLDPESFDSCEIRNVEVDDIRASSLVGILSSLKPNAPVTVLVCQPIAVMQPYEAKMIEANARLAGFVNIKTSPSTFFNDYSNEEEETLCVTFNKPEIAEI